MVMCVMGSQLCTSAMLSSLNSFGSMQNLHFAALLLLRGQEVALSHWPLKKGVGARSYTFSTTTDSAAQLMHQAIAGQPEGKCKMIEQGACPAWGHRPGYCRSTSWNCLDFSHWLDSSTTRQFHKGAAVDYKMESVVVFNSVWRRFTEKHGQDFCCPREVVFLNGAPGSGKGENLPHIMKIKGATTSVCVSPLLLDNPEAKKLMDNGDMVGDVLVCELLLEVILTNKKINNSLVVDGFPRTAVQVDFLKLLSDKLQEIHDQHADSPLWRQFPRPLFKVVVLYVDAETSIQRQMERARLARMVNSRVQDAGAGVLREERSTDVDQAKCMKRYQTFKEHYSAILRLKQYFPFHLIDAMGSPEETREQITKELRYQSSLDLNEATYSVVRRLPLAKDLVKTGRQGMVTRLDGYQEQCPELFEQVVAIIEADVIPIVRQAVLSGLAEYRTRSSFFTMNPICADMLVDIMSDRGFSVSYLRDEVPLPTHIDLATGRIMHKREPVHRFRMFFDTQGVRDAFKAMEIAARVAEATRGARISQSFIPEQMDYEAQFRRKDASLSENGEEAGVGVPACSGLINGNVVYERRKMKRCNNMDQVRCNAAEDVDVLQEVR